MPHITPKPDIPSPSKPIKDEGEGLLSNTRKTKPKGPENLIIKEVPVLSVMLHIVAYIIGILIGLYLHNNFM